MQQGGEVSLQLAVKAYFEAITRLVEDVLELATLEGKLAGRTLVWMAALGVGAGALILTAWGMANAALILWLSSTPLGLKGALLGMALVNLLTGLALILWVLRVSRYLTFPATRRVILRHGQPD